MIVPRYSIQSSKIPNAGKGLFLEEDVAQGRVIIAPSNVHTLVPEKKLLHYPVDSIEMASAVRWFENWYSLSPEWCDECYANHSFNPSGILHLGFVFAASDLAAGSEVTIDYSYFVTEKEVCFIDGVTGRPVIGLEWQQSFIESAQKVLQLFQPALTT